MSQSLKIRVRDERPNLEPKLYTIDLDPETFLNYPALLTEIASLINGDESEYS
jgi:DNA repair exonuclease SbcCD ATPase subunit